jgi:ATP-dependent RNA helicase SUPV3L1/SUV3
VDASDRLEGVLSSGAGGATQPVVEEPEIEVWRPARFERHARPQHRRRPGGDGDHRRAGDGDHRRHGPGERRHPAPSGEAPAIAAPPAPGDRDQRRRGGKPPRPFDGGRQEDGGPKDGSRPREERRFEGRGNGGKPMRGRDDRPDRGDRRERDNERAPRAWSSEQRPAGRDNRAPDPNSPFAKLLALKEQMQGQKPDKSQ